MRRERASTSTLADVLHRQRYNPVDMAFGQAGASCAGRLPPSSIFDLQNGGGLEGVFASLLAQEQRTRQGLGARHFGSALQPQGIIPPLFSAENGGGLEGANQVHQPLALLAPVSCPQGVL